MPPGPLQRPCNPIRESAREARKRGKRGKKRIFLQQQLWGDRAAPTPPRRVLWPSPPSRVPPASPGHCPAPGGHTALIKAAIWRLINTNGVKYYTDQKCLRLPCPRPFCCSRCIQESVNPPSPALPKAKGVLLTPGCPPRFYHLSVTGFSGERGSHHLPAETAPPANPR